MVENREYEVGPFTDLDETWGDRLWAFLNEPGNVRRMIERSDAGRPAAEGIADALYQAYGEPVKEGRVKQFTGFLIRRVMERHGYRLLRYGVALRANPVFSYASRYVRHED